MSVVNTVNGPIDSADLGRVLMHEHIFILSPEMMQNYETGWHEEERVQDAIEKLQALKSAGIDTLVDQTCVGYGRYIPRIQRIAKEVDVHILVPTGLIDFYDIPHYFAYGRAPRGGSRDTLVDIFVSEITEGIAGGPVKASFIKVATQNCVTPGLERILVAAAKAHVETGAPISTHTDGKRGGTAQQDILEREGVALSRVIIGHCGDSTDLDYLRGIMDRGSYAGMDRFGLYPLFAPDDEQRARVVAELCSQGYADKMLLSHDANCYIDWNPGTTSLAPNSHFRYIPEVVVPMLRDLGVTEHQLDTMLVGNPRTILEIPVPSDRPAAGA
jgi:phosphotriesterase-related protein